MKSCSKCGVANPPSARFCTDCGQEFQPTAAPGSYVDRLKTSLRTKASRLESRRKADILFVVDCTASMSGELEAIKESIIDFANSIETDGVRARVGLIEFRDRLIGEEHRVLSFDGDPFTSDPRVFREQVALLEAYGGGDEPESSLDAIMLAVRQPFQPDASRVIVLVTDAPPHVPDKDAESIEEVASTLLKREIHQMYIVMRTEDPESQIYLKLLEGRQRGLAFELGVGDDFRNRKDNFKRTLMALGKTISAATR